MKFTDNGTLTVKTAAAGGALPIEGALIIIRGAEEENRFVEYSLKTDQDGLTDTVSLPTPALEYSLTPTPTEIPYAKYDIEALAEGYNPIRIIGASVFANTHSLQVINMIPLADNSELADGSLTTDLDNEE